ncbi:selenocysteine-specific translation elongation factor [Tuberibacillus calidus]|uniref:selenocysteine-specific translation elongation factor n=1 Tax=Tuberibacillus calidus TaxID=340097 RepID=UPI000420B273|nr:selenocysteine-specific translation elongation factor [Tuberibacillus calidus]
MQPFFTIGIAGHIDHGKTALTKALTNIETDRLVEEKKRKISIVNGYAFLDLDDGRRAAVIDVPGHERFIRQMIAGCAGIDLVLLVVAADEGVMPQTREHFEILRLLGIHHILVVMTKVGLVDEALLVLVEAEIRELLEGTVYEGAPIYKVDSLLGIGIPALKQAIFTMAKRVKGKNAADPLRLPIDDIFTIHGHGTVVRGTIFNGQMTTAEPVTLLPQNKIVRIKQLQVHHVQVQRAMAGQRVAVNLAGVDASEVKRGDCLVSSDFYKPTERIDVRLHGLKTMSKPVKQRAPLALHIGTATVQGRLILFDRKRWQAGESVYAQIELTRPVVTQKGDRFIVRRPSPAETLGGGEVIDPLAEKHRFGEETVKTLATQLKGNPEEWIQEALKKNFVLEKQQLMRSTGLKPGELDLALKTLVDQGMVVPISQERFALTSERQRLADQLTQALARFHETHPLLSGLNRAEWLGKGKPYPQPLIEAACQFLIQNGTVCAERHIVRLSDFTPHYPEKWAKKLAGVEKTLHLQGMCPEAWSDLMADFQIPASVADDFRRYLLDQRLAYPLTDDRLLSGLAFRQALDKLKKGTGHVFTIKEAKGILHLTRKNLIPFLELLDDLKLTKREGNAREWLVEK